MLDFSPILSTKWAPKYYVRVKYSMCDLICDVISCCDWSSDTDEVNSSDKIVIENQKKENMEIKGIFFTSLHLKDGLGTEFTAC